MKTPNTMSSYENSATVTDVMVWADPNDVVDNPEMTRDEKRALLASWASDARAVPNQPPLRQLESGAFVTIDAVLGALKRLDDVDHRVRPSVPDEEPREGHWSRLSRQWRRGSRDDDDDDPFSPARCARLGFRRWKAQQQLRPDRCRTGPGLRTGVHLAPRSHPRRRSFSFRRFAKHPTI